MNRPKIIAIVGPTASGKTALSVWLAQKIGAEIISADSRQVYKGMDIGTGKVTKKEMAGIPHHLLDVVSPLGRRTSTGEAKSQFSVDDFVRLSERALSYILENKRIPILVGGTGLYIDTLLGRMGYPNVGPNPTLRKQLEQLTTKQLLARLQKADPRRAKSIDPYNPRRLVRALEVAKAIGKSPSYADAMGQSSSLNNPRGAASWKYDVLWLGLSPAPKKLKANIHKRIISRMRAGMVAEAKRLHKQGVSYKRMHEMGLEYRSLARFLQKKISKGELVQEIEKGNRNYAKRQATWFKRNKDITWVSGKTEALRLAKGFLSR